MIEVKAPCCSSVRECNVRRIVIVDISAQKVLKELEAVRCHRGESRTYKINVSGRTVVAEVYRSNRGKWYVTILWKPDSMDELTAEITTKKALGIYEEVEVEV